MGFRQLVRAWNRKLEDAVFTQHNRFAAPTKRSGGIMTFLAWGSSNLGLLDTVLHRPGPLSDHLPPVR